MDVTGIKNSICGTVGIVGGAVASLFGGWDSALNALFIAMIIDYLSGMAVAGIFKKSGKSENGAMSSSAGFKGLCKKFMVLF